MYAIFLRSVFLTLMFYINWTPVTGKEFPSGPLTFREKVARYKLLKGTTIIQPSLPNADKNQYLEYFKEGTVEDAQNDFLSINPSNVTFSKERLTLEGVVGDHVWLILSKTGRYQVPTLTIYTSTLNRQGRPTVVVEVINYAFLDTNENHVEQDENSHN